MEEENLGSFCIKCFLLISLAVCVSNAHEFQCPRSLQWLFRAQSHCLITGGYICLLDENTKKFTEICRNRTYSDRAGYKLVIAGNLDQRKCESTRYQPFRFSTNGMSTCVFEKTYCNEEGLIVFNNGSTKTDKQCRCDYTRGYDFISKPKHGCYCIPSMDDCSCYQKPCPQGFILSPDYQCINLATWDAQFTCQLIVPYQSPNTKFPIDDTDTDESKIAQTENRKIEIVIVISITLTVALIMALLTQFCLPKIDSITEQNTELKSLLTKTVIPSDIRDTQTHLKGRWKVRFSHFVETRAFHLILKSIEKEQCIIVSGPMGCGKSSTAFHIAMAFDKTEDCDVMIISYLDDLFKYASKDKKQLFLIDDVFGEYSVSDYKSMWWNHHGTFVQNILNENKDLKLVLTSRLHIFLTVKPTKPSFCHLDFTSEDLKLSLEERKKIGRCYLRDDIIDDIGSEVIMSTSFFPTLCANVDAEKNYYKEHVIEYFTLPVKYISSETNKMRTSRDAFFYALTILLIFDNKVKKDFFNEDSHQYDEMMQFLSKEIGFDTQPLKSLLFSRFIALKKSYVLENKEYFECLYINLFNALVVSIGPCIVRTLIIYGESSFLNKRTCHETSDGTYPKLKIVIPKELQDMYFERMLSDVKLGKYDLFEGDQHFSVEFRKSLIAYLKKYLNKGDLKKGSHGTKVLHVVSAKGFYDYVEFFLGLEKTLGNVKDNDGQTALHKACMHGHTHVANILLDNDASIDLTDNNNETALCIACKNNKSETVEYLLSRGANVQPKTCDLKFLLHAACLKGNKDIAKFLLAKINVNYQDSNKHTPLHLACANGRAKIVKLLVRHKLDINLVDYESKTAMYIAAEQGNTDIVRCLMGLSPKLDIATDRGRVALHCASEYGFEEIARLLIEQKAEINLADKDGVTPLYVACENGQLKIVKLLLDNNAIVDISNEFKSTPLFIACENDNTEIVRLLLERKADANFNNSDQMTPLHKACGSDQTGIVSLLIKYGASVNKPDKDLQTPLTIACLKGNYNVADALLKVGASVNYANRTGLTPLHAACLREQKEIVSLLLDYDADINKKDTDGLTPLAVACKSGNKCIEDTLLIKLHDKQKPHQVSK